MKRYIILLLVCLVCMSFSAFANIEETPEIIQDAQAETLEAQLLEPHEQEAAADQLPTEPEPLTEIVEDEQIDPFNVPAPEYWENDIESEYEEPAPLSYSDATLADINYTLNSIFFCIVICIACAFVYLVVKIVSPLFRADF